MSKRDGYMVATIIVTKAVVHADELVLYRTVRYCTAVYSTILYSTILTYLLPVWCFHCCSLQLMKSISDKHEEVMARMGSIMAAGILDAGERHGTCVIYMFILMDNVQAAIVLAPTF